MIGTTLGYDAQGSLVMVVVGDRAPDRDEWTKYVEFLRDRIASHGKVRLMVFAGTGAPDVVQRKQLGDAVSTAQLRTAVLSDSFVARGVVTAFRWYGLDLDAFKGDAIDEACRFLHTTHDESEWLRRSLASIRSGLIGPRAAAR